MAVAGYFGTKYQLQCVKRVPDDGRRASEAEMAPGANGQTEVA